MEAPINNDSDKAIEKGAANEKKRPIGSEVDKVRLSAAALLVKKKHMRDEKSVDIERNDCIESS